MIEYNGRCPVCGAGLDLENDMLTCKHRPEHYKISEKRFSVLWDLWNKRKIGNAVTLMEQLLHWNEAEEQITLDEIIKRDAKFVDMAAGLIIAPMVTKTTRMLKDGRS